MSVVAGIVYSCTLFIQHTLTSSCPRRLLTPEHNVVSLSFGSIEEEVRTGELKEEN